jgi:hypothetical protein
MARMNSSPGRSVLSREVVALLCAKAVDLLNRDVEEALARRAPKHRYLPPVAILIAQRRVPQPDTTGIRLITQHAQIRHSSRVRALSEAN